MKRTKRVFTVLLVLCLVIMEFPCRVYAVEELMQEDNNSTRLKDESDELVLYGDAIRLEDGSIQLTELATWKSGSAWYGHQISAASGFETTFSYWAGGGRDYDWGGADGITLTFSMETGLGEAGGYLGFVGQDAYGVELDSYPHNSNDPSGKHIAIIKEKASNHLTYVIDNRVDDSEWHTLVVTYNSPTLKVSLDGELMLSYDDVSLPEEVYLGISAATGSGINQHLIKDFYIKGVVSEGTSFEEDNHPVIIIPGIMGSRLFTSTEVFDDTTKAWDPVISFPCDGITKLNERLNNKNTLYVRPCENQNNMEKGTIAKYGREYGAVDTYKEIVDGICDAFPDREVYVFSYDWRKSNSVSADRLNDFIEELNAEKVDIVCHSMGGLVVSGYYSKYASAGRVDKIITCGTPYEGAPKLINSVMNWDVLGEGTSIDIVEFYKDPDFQDCMLGFIGGMTKQLKASFMGVVELTPTQNYVSKIPMYMEGGGLLARKDLPLSYEKYAEICKVIFGDNYEAAQNFQTSLHTGGEEDGYNVLLDYENSYFVIGTNHKTISSIKFQYSTNDMSKTLYESDLGYETLGDGTVPYLSASIMEQIETLDSSRWKTFDASHNGVVSEQKCIDWIEDILRYGFSPIEGDSINAKPYTVIRVACPVDVTVTNGEEMLSSSLEQLALSSSFGRLDILGENDEIKMLCIDAEDMNVVINGTDSGTMDYSIRFFDEEGTLCDERVFENVPITENTLIYTSTGETDNTILELDSEGDGNVDTTWTASSNEWVTASDDERVPLEAIQLEVEASTLEIGEMMSATITNCPDNSNDKVEVYFTSSNDLIATVDNNGVITAVSEGTVLITATATNGMTAALEITVTEHMHQYVVDFDWAEDNQTCVATFTCSGCGDVQEVEAEVIVETIPATCTEEGKTTYKALARYGDITAEELGETVIIPAIGKQLPLQDIRCNDSFAKKIGDKDFHLNAKNVSNPSSKMLYSSSNENVATVSKEGKVSIKGEGTAVITITAPEVKDKYGETVKEVTVTVKAREEMSHHKPDNPKWGLEEWKKRFHKWF